MKVLKFAAVVLLAVGMFSTTAIAAPEDDCAGAIPVAVGSSSPLLTPCADTTPTGTDGSCVGFGLPQYAGTFDVWVSFVATGATHRVRTDVASTGSDSNYGVFGGGCGGLAEVGCSEDEASPYLGNICVGGLTPGSTYHVQLGAFCDGCFGACAGGYSVTVQPDGDVCGDGFIACAGNELCDDGNLTDGDGCDSNCTPTGCGNGVITAGETCDDGNLVDDDGCDSNCTPTGCGNGIVTSGELCDDGNLIDGDGCSSVCVGPVCGDGIVDAGIGEECDGMAAAACAPGGSCNSICRCIVGIPAVSEWGLLVLVLVGLTVGTVMFGRRREATA